MIKNSTWKRAVLLVLLVLPFLLYFIFVYLSEETFFEKLAYAGPERVVEHQENGRTLRDTLPYRIPSYEFTTQHDTTLSDDDLRGNIYLANFFFSSCPTVCPAMNYQVQQVQNRFKGYDHFRIASFSVDPEYDTPAVLRDYAREMNAIPGIWYFLTGDQDSIYSTAEDFFLNAMEDSTAPGGFLHSQHLVLVDWKGRIRSRKDENGNIKAVYDGTSLDEVNKLKDDIKVLIAEHEKWKSMEEYRASKED